MRDKAKKPNIEVGYPLLGTCAVLLTCCLSPYRSLRNCLLYNFSSFGELKRFTGLGLLLGSRDYTSHMPRIITTLTPVTTRLPELGLWNLMWRSTHIAKACCQWRFVVLTLHKKKSGTMSVVACLDNPGEAVIFTNFVAVNEIVFSYIPVGCFRSSPPFWTSYYSRPNLRISCRPGGNRTRMGVLPSRFSYYTMLP